MRTKQKYRPPSPFVPGSLRTGVGIVLLYGSIALVQHSPLWVILIGIVGIVLGSYFILVGVWNIVGAYKQGAREEARAKMRKGGRYGS